MTVTKKEWAALPWPYVECLRRPLNTPSLPRLILRIQPDLPNLPSPFRYSPTPQQVPISPTVKARYTNRKQLEPMATAMATLCRRRGCSKSAVFNQALLRTFVSSTDCIQLICMEKNASSCSSKLSLDMRSNFSSPVLATLQLSLIMSHISPDMWRRRKHPSTVSGNSVEGFSFNTRIARYASPLYHQLIDVVTLLLRTYENKFCDLMIQWWSGAHNHVRKRLLLPSFFLFVWAGWKTCCTWLRCTSMSASVWQLLC